MADISKVLKLITLELYEKLASRISDIIKNIELTPGPQGEKGDPGPQGPTGPKGNKGDTGPQGPVGATGAKGNTGDRGPQGYTFTPKVDSSGNLSWTNNGGLDNPQVVNIKGPQGERGATGDRGPQGPTGPQGEPGEDGAPGERGPQGLQGATGPQGPAGPKGDTGDQGPQGPAGSNATVTVDSSLDSSSSNPVQNKVINAELDKKLPRTGAAISGDFMLNAYNGEISLEAESTINILSNGSGIILNSEQGIYYNSLTKRIVRAAATKVVGTSKSGHTVVDCDYLCDGTADQVEINDAINALPSGGGKVILLEGTYNLTDAITIDKSNVTICGMGAGTIVKRSTQFTPMINLNADHCKICEFIVDGNYDSLYESGYPYNVFIAAANCSVTDMEIKNGGQGIVYTKDASYMLIARNRITHLSGNAVMSYELSYDGPAMMVNNYIYDMGSFGIQKTWRAHIIGNVFDVCNCGVSLGDECNVSGNVFYNIPHSNISMDGSNNTVTGNSCSSIYAHGTGNIIVGNHCHGKSVTDDGSNNLKANNQ